ncbi:MAG: hypothetical protein PHV39_03020 [Methanomicrobium sp.]|nr:hypothetical protein [Methanomicrobium sp.]
MKISESLCTGKKVKAGEFEITPVIRSSVIITDSGGMCSAEPVGLLFLSEKGCFKLSLKNDDSWIEELLGT